LPTDCSIMENVVKSCFYTKTVPTNLTSSQGQVTLVHLDGEVGSAEVPTLLMLYLVDVTLRDMQTTALQTRELQTNHGEGRGLLGHEVPWPGHRKGLSPYPQPTSDCMATSPRPSLQLLLEGLMYGEKICHSDTRLPRLEMVWVPVHMRKFSNLQGFR
jgi:hypothetical protein